MWKKIDMWKEQVLSNTDAVTPHRRDWWGFTALSVPAFSICSTWLGPSSSFCDDSTNRKGLWLIVITPTPPNILHSDARTLTCSVFLMRFKGRRQDKSLICETVTDAVIHQQKHISPCFRQALCLPWQWLKIVIQTDKYTLESCKHGCFWQRISNKVHLETVLKLWITWVGFL